MSDSPSCSSRQRKRERDVVPSGSPVAGLLRALLCEANPWCYVTLINDTSAASDGRRTSAGAASDLHGLLAAGESPLSRKPIQAPLPCSGAFGVLDCMGGNSMCGRQPPNLTLRAHEEWAHSKEASRILLQACDPKRSQLCQSPAPPLVSRAFQHGKTDACGSEHALGSSGQLLWFVCTRRVEFICGFTGHWRVTVT